MLIMLILASATNEADAKKRVTQKKKSSVSSFVGTWKLVDKDKGGLERYLVIEKEGGYYYGQLFCHDIDHTLRYSPATQGCQ